MLKIGNNIHAFNNFPNAPS